MERKVLEVVRPRSELMALPPAPPEPLVERVPTLAPIAPPLPAVDQATADKERIVGSEVETSLCALAFPPRPPEPAWPGFPAGPCGSPNPPSPPFPPLPPVAVAL